MTIDPNSRPHSVRRVLSSASILAGSIAVVLSGVSAHAASGTWLGTVDATWAGANWSASPVPGAGDTAVFNGTGNGSTTIDFGTGVTVGAITFDTASAAAYTIGSGGVGAQALTLGGHECGDIDDQHGGQQRDDQCQPRAWDRDCQHDCHHE